MLKRPIHTWRDLLEAVIGLISAFAIGIGICVLICACTHTKYITQTQTKIDTLRIYNLQRDSIHVHDSVFVDRFMRGDTCFLTKYIEHTAFKDCIIVDTMYKYTARQDTVQQVREVEVERKASTWEKIRMWLGTVFLIILFLVISFFIGKLVKSH